MKRSAGPSFPWLLGPLVITIVTASFRFSSIEPAESATDASLQWSVLKQGTSTPRGPSNLGVQLRGVASRGRTLIAVAPMQSVRSDDGGATWRDLDGLRDALDALIVDDSLVLVSMIRGGLYRSIDGGRSFTNLKFGTGSGIPGMAAAGDTLFAIGNQVMLRSVDRGVTWTKVPVPRVTLVEVAARQRLVLAVGSGGFVRRSDDRGATWTDRWLPTYSQLTGVAFADDTTAVVVGANGVVLRSLDAGRSWKPVQSPTTETLRGVAFLDGRHGLAVGFWGESIATSDGGASWRRERTGTDAHLWGVAATADGFVAAGLFETILRARVP